MEKIILEVVQYLLNFLMAGIAVLIARALKKFINTDTKKKVVQTVVGAVEQVYTDIHGADKLAEAMRIASELLTEKGIKVSQSELEVLIESAVSEFNDAFNKNKE